MEPLEIAGMVISVAYHGVSYLRRLVGGGGHARNWIGVPVRTPQDVHDVQGILHSFRETWPIQTEDELLTQLHSIAEEFQMSVLIRRLQKFDDLEYARLDSYVLEAVCTRNELRRLVVEGANIMSHGATLEDEAGQPMASATPILFEVTTTSFVSNGYIGLAFSALICMMIQARATELGPQSQDFQRVRAHACDDEVGLNMYEENTIVLRGGMRYADLGDADFSVRQPDRDLNTYLIGKTGSGKSTVGNALMQSFQYGGRPFRVVQGSTGTYAPSVRSTWTKKRFRRIIDTPGLSDQSQADIVYLANLHDTVDLLRTYNKVILVINVDDRRNIMDEITSMVRVYSEIFSSSFTQFCTPVFTYQGEPNDGGAARQLALHNARHDLQLLLASQYVHETARVILLDLRAVRDNEDFSHDIDALAEAMTAPPQPVSSLKAEICRLRGLMALGSSQENDLSPRTTQMASILRDHYEEEARRIMLKMINSRRTCTLTIQPVQQSSSVHLRTYDGESWTQRLVELARGFGAASLTEHERTKISLHWRLPFHVPSLQPSQTREGVWNNIKMILDLCKNHQYAPLITNVQEDDSAWRRKLTIIIGVFKFTGGPLSQDILERMEWLKIHTHHIFQLGVQAYTVGEVDTCLPARLKKLREYPV